MGWPEMPRTNDARAPLIVASNRLPIALARDPGITVCPSAGGLATALRGVQDETDFVWVGWPGADVSTEEEPLVTALLRERGLVPVFLSARERIRYYNGFCNGVLWPLFHYFTDRVRFDERAFTSYEAVNARFARAIAHEAPPGARVWVHDFQLMLVPRLLRALRPDLEIAFFLHIPFPSSEIYRSLPVREAILLGLLGADYVGFQTADYARHFRSSCLRILGFDSDPDGVACDGRRVGIGSHPIGIPVTRFRRALESPAAHAYRAELERRYRGRKVVLGVERLDYTKGIPHKFHAYEAFLRRDPERAREVVLLQLIVPSRLDNPEYRKLKQEIEEYVGRLNGRYGMPGITPVEYLHRSLDVERLAALYAFVDVMLVTPIRDGMNLVAQEFVACQAAAHEAWGRPPGALVLSEFAGAAHSLSRSILVNPWDVQRTATAIEGALAMPEAERGERVLGMAEHVGEMESEAWARQFLRAAGAYVAQQREAGPAPHLDDPGLRELAARAAEAKRRIFFLDYDGTLREYTRFPGDARPTDEIREVLRALARLPATEVHVVSGRDRKQLEAWLGELPIHLCAEHGYVARAPGGAWEALEHVSLEWLPRAEEELRRVVQEVPGSLIERKPCSVAWHYRMADAHYGSWRARELCTALEDEFANQPVEVLLGHKVLEVRAAGVNKGGYVRRRMAGVDESAFVLCVGDDRTDMDMYCALPPSAFSIHLGPAAEGVRYRLDSAGAVRGLLRLLAGAVEHRAHRPPLEEHPG
jgi:trehalose 6-phosphate synthase/phosphatase